ncbi:MAG: putative DNA-binding protein [Gallicola sp.]|nr:putative DNA-binding protein [Gallicola sp.]
MDKVVEIGILFDYYGKLLTDKQFEIVDQYYNEDLSLSEIAEIHGISKQAVSENLKRAEKKLYDYEKKLMLVERNQKISKGIQKALEEMKRLLSTKDEYLSKKELEDLLGLFEEYERERLEAIGYDI